MQCEADHNPKELKGGVRAYVPSRCDHRFLQNDEATQAPESSAEYADHGVRSALVLGVERGRLAGIEAAGGSIFRFVEPESDMEGVSRRDQGSWRKLPLAKLAKGRYVLGISGDPYFAYCTFDLD